MTHGEAGDLEFNDNLEEINDIHVSLPPSEAGTYSGDYHANKSVTRWANEVCTLIESPKCWAFVNMSKLCPTRF